MNQETQSRLSGMGQRLAQSVGLRNFTSMPITNSALKEQAKAAPLDSNTEVGQDPNKDPKHTNISPTNIRPVKTKESAADILGKMYNFMRVEHSKSMANMVADKKFNQKLEKIKIKHNDELITIFDDIRKTREKQKRKEDKKKTEPTTTTTTEPPTTPTAPTTPPKTTGAAPTTTAPPKTTGAPATTKRTTKPVTEVKPPVSTATKVGAGVVGAVAAGSAASVIAKEEGSATKAYWDPKDQRDKVSIGFGHQIKPEEYNQGYIQIGNEQVPIKGQRGIDTTMTKEQAKKLLEIDIPKYEDAAKRPLGDSWNKLNQNQKDALTSYAYNTGEGTKQNNRGVWGLVNAGLKDAIDRGDFEGAAAIIRDKGVKTAGGKYNKTLDERRQREAALFLTSVKQDPKQIPSQKNMGEQLDNSSRNNKDLKNQGKQSSGDVTILNKNTNIINGSNIYQESDESKYTSPTLKQYVIN